MKEKVFTTLTKDNVNELNKVIVVLDTETTGFSPYSDRIIEFAGIKLKNGKEIDRLSILINPRITINSRATAVHGLTNKMLMNEPTEDVCVHKIHKFLTDIDYIVGHNVAFDVNFLEQMFVRNDLEYDFKYLDTLAFAKNSLKNVANYKLTTLAEYFKIDVETAHRALADVETTISVLRYLSYLAMRS